MVPLGCPEYPRWSLQQGKCKVFLYCGFILTPWYKDFLINDVRRLGKPGQLPETSWQYDKHGLFLHLFCLRVVEQTPHVRWRGINSSHLDVDDWQMWSWGWGWAAGSRLFEIGFAFGAVWVMTGVSLDVAFGPIAEVRWLETAKVQKRQQASSRMPRIKSSQSKLLRSGDAWQVMR